MHEYLEALQMVAVGGRHPLLHALIRLGWAIGNPVQLTEAGKAKRRLLEQEHQQASHAEFPDEEPEEEDGYFPEP